jgi:tRNA(Ile2) C34 agmatinyltransferase TiaS
MKILVAVDDTDNLESPGSGQLSANLADVLVKEHLVTSYSNITRHQLYVHPSIPYTSGNSSMCFAADTASGSLDGLIQYTADYLRQFSAPGSDPGLCVAVVDDTLDRTGLVQFGHDAKQVKISKEDAYQLAAHHNVHLSEHGGTGLGVIGALAGIGLRLSGNDGRFRGWLKFGEQKTVTTVDALTSHPDRKSVV